VYNFDRLTAIGAFAAQASSGCNHSVFVGPYAGRSRKGANSVIISNRSEAPTLYDAPWSEDNEKIVDIAEIFQGYVPQVDQYSALHIGRPLDDDGGDIDGNEISDSALNITSPFKSNTILTLRFDPSATGVVTTNQADAVRSQMRDSTGYPEATWNSIINANGLLNLPVARSFANTGSNTILYDSNGVEIVKKAGVIVQYQVQQLGSYEHGVAIAVNNGSLGGPLVWKKIQISDEFAAAT
jgi:hypothetical protein